MDIRCKATHGDWGVISSILIPRAAILLVSTSRKLRLVTPIQEKTGSRMETRPKGPSVFESPGGKYKLDKQSLSKEFQDGATEY